MRRPRFVWPGPARVAGLSGRKNEDQEGDQGQIALLILATAPVSLVLSRCLNAAERRVDSSRRFQ